LAVKTGEWVVLGVKHTGKGIECSLDGKKLLDVSDDTFPNAGQVDVWCKADAVSHFVQFKFTPAKKGKRSAACEDFGCSLVARYDAL
jgi:hypothetical protein